VATIDRSAIRSASELGLFSRALKSGELNVLRPSILTALNYLGAVVGAAGGINQSQLSEVLLLNINTVQQYTRLLAELNLIFVVRQKSVVGRACIIHPINKEGNKA
jgi:hypothetical protein